MEFILPVVLALITSILGPIIVEWVRKKLNKTQTTDPLGNKVKKEQDKDRTIHWVQTLQTI